MKRGLNKTTLIGNVGAEDARLGTMPNSGTPVLYFSLAVNDFYRDVNSGEEKKTTDWFKVTIYGERAKALAPYITTGKCLYLEGKVGVKAWQPKDENNQPIGEPRGDVTLKVRELLFLDSSKQSDELSGEVNGEAFGVVEDGSLFPTE